MVVPRAKSAPGLPCLPAVNWLKLPKKSNKNGTVAILAFDGVYLPEHGIDGLARVSGAFEFVVDDQQGLFGGDEKFVQCGRADLEDFEHDLDLALGLQ